MSNFQRRDFLTGAAAFAAATTATLVGTRRTVADDKPPEPIRGKEAHRSLAPRTPHARPRTWTGLSRRRRTTARCPT